MKNNLLLLTTIISILISGLIFGQGDILIWNGTQEELAQFIKSKEDKKIGFALQKIIEKPEILKTSETAYDIYKIYRNHQNDKLRQMALIALYKAEYYFLLKNLRDDLYEDRNQKIRCQIYRILENMTVLKSLN